ncbi:MAG: hypothetical protein IT521_05445 [Burkholderiales bacterium]|nr:hypothetical protein [Burkholderiales bacterium]
MNHRSLRAIGALFALLSISMGSAQPMASAPPTIVTKRALDCEDLSGPDAAQALSALPAPRVVLLHGSMPIVNMESFAHFLIGMGYPEAALRDPQDGVLSRSSFGSSVELAGALAWHYERDGMRPMLIGHSQGGMLVIRALHELAGGFQDSIPVFDPGRGAALDRTTIRDPYTHQERPVVGVQVAFAAAIATGTLPRILLGQWSMIPLLRRIPDTTLEFTGFTIAWDPLAGNLGSAEPYAADGRAVVRNVLLPSTYSHIGAPITEHLAAQAATRAWIDTWRPDAAPGPEPDAANDDLRNLVLAADLWFSIRRHWCLEGQRRRAATS